MTNKELKERVNHIESELQQIKQQLQLNKKITTIPKEYKFTEDEKTILRNLDKKYKWLARDSSKDLYI